MYLHFLSSEIPLTDLVSSSDIADQGMVLYRNGTSAEKGGLDKAVATLAWKRSRKRKPQYETRTGVKLIMAVLSRDLWLAW